MNQADRHDRLDRSENEISLVDLATTFIRRRRIFYVVFGGLMVVALIYALIVAEEAHEYATLVQLAEQTEENETKPFQPPAAVIASIENRWYPGLLATYVEVEGEKLPFEILASNPNNTLLIKLVSEGSPDLANKIKKTHQQVVDQILLQQSQLFERQKHALEQRLSSVNEYLDQLSTQEAAGEIGAQIIQNRVELNAQLESLQPAEALVLARKSIDSKGVSKMLILGIATVFGLLLGIFSAFMAEFVFNVRQELAKKDRSEGL